MITGLDSGRRSKFDSGLGDHASRAHPARVGPESVLPASISYVRSQCVSLQLISNDGIALYRADTTRTNVDVSLSQTSDSS